MGAMARPRQLAVERDAGGEEDGPRHVEGDAVRLEGVDAAGEHHGEHGEGGEGESEENDLRDA